DVGVNGNVRQVAEIVLSVADLVGVAQRGGEQPLPLGLKRNHTLAFGENQSPERHHGLAAHGLSDHRKGLLPDRLVRSYIIRTVEVALVDLRPRYEAIDFDHVSALDLDCFQLRIVHENVLALGQLVAPALVLRADRLARLFIDELLAQTIAGDLVDLAKSDALSRRGCGMQGDRAGDEGKLEVAFPKSTHNQLLWGSGLGWRRCLRGKIGRGHFARGLRAIAAPTSLIGA